MIPCYKEHDKSFIWYYYTYDISKAILDLDPDLCQNFLFFVTLLILAHTDMYDTSKERLCPRASFLFLTRKRFEQFMGTLWPKNWKKQTFLLVTVSCLHIESSVIPPLIASMKGCISSSTSTSYEQYMRTLWPQNMKIWWFKCALWSLIHLICSKRLIFETTS